MTNKIRITLLMLLTLALIGVAAPPVFAQDNSPPEEPTEEKVVQEVKFVVTTTFQKLYEERAPSPLGVLPGPGGQSAVLTSILYSRIYSTYVKVRGQAEVEVFGNPLPTAKAWTTLFDSGLPAETSRECWTSAAINPCLSQTRDHQDDRGLTWKNIAETWVFWSGGGSTHGSAVAEKQIG